MFHTVLANLKSPENVGLIVRSHVAFGGSDIIFIGEPWHLSKRAKAFSRGLERLCTFQHFPDEDDFFQWVQADRLPVIALEISQAATPIAQYTFPENLVLAVGSEALGLSATFLDRATDIVVIPQTGPVGSLNVAITASIAMHYVMQGKVRSVVGNKFDVPREQRRARE